MEVYDVIMLIVLVGAIAFGFWKGLAWQVASLAAVFLSYFVAYHFRDALAEKLSAEPPWNKFLAMLILYVGTSLVIWIGFRVVKDGLDRMKLKEFDSQLGAALGAVKGGIVCLIITFFALTLLSDSQKDQVCCSYSGYVMGHAIDRLNVLLPAETHAVIGPYLEKLDNELEHDHSNLATETFTGDAATNEQQQRLDRGMEAARSAKAALEAANATLRSR